MDKIILITNDDGYRANGIKTLIEIAREYGQVVVVAPDKSWSGKSHSISLEQPIHLSSLKNFYHPQVEAYISTGTPVDCIKLAINKILKQKPNLILSGINHGPNFAINAFYSATVAAALEGSFNGIPSIALSHVSLDTNADLNIAIENTKILLDDFFSSNTQEPFCFNVNFPNIKLSENKGIKFTRSTRSVWLEEFVERIHPSRKQKYYWLTGKIYNFEPEANDTDLWAIENNYTSVVPLSFDLTDYKILQKLKNKDLTIKNKKQL